MVVLLEKFYIHMTEITQPTFTQNIISRLYVPINQDDNIIADRNTVVMSTTKNNVIVKRKSERDYDDESIKEELKSIMEKIGHFPIQKELRELGKSILIHAIQRNGGLDKFRKLFGLEPIQKPNGFWTFEKTIEEIQNVINQIGRFPSPKDLDLINKKYLKNAIYQNGGSRKLRKLFGQEPLHKPDGFWTRENLIKEIDMVIEKIGHFPSQVELILMNRSDIIGAVKKYGGMDKIRKEMGYELLHNPFDYWTKEITIIKIKEIIDKIGHFPNRNEIYIYGERGLSYATRKIGINNIRESLGYTISMYEEYKSKLHSYTSKRGKKTENIINKILIEYCSLHGLLPPKYNVKLSKGNVIEFVCNTNKTIGIDVTNTKHGKNCVCNKWTKKEYYKHLDELWIVVFSISFKDSDYKKWNSSSPENVKVMSIYQFLEELDYSLDEHTKNKIDKYNSCTFHTKEQLKNKKETIQISLFQ